MRIRVAKFVTAFVIVLNFIAILFIWKLLSSHGKPDIFNDSFVYREPKLAKYGTRASEKSLQSEVTVVLRSFEHFENDVAETVKSALTLYPNISVLVVTDTPVYPPINITGIKSVKLLNLKKNLDHQYEDVTPILKIKTKYTFFIPDSTRFFMKNLFDKLINISRLENIVAVPYNKVKVEAPSIKCLKIHFDTREWFIRFEKGQEINECDYLKGKHALFTHTSNLHKLPDPLLQPFPDSLYIQSSYKNIKAIVAENINLKNGRELFKSRHNYWKWQQAERDREKVMFHTLQLKKVIREDGQIEWYGCKRDTPRCFGSIIDETPQYLLEGKWTPPCCLAGLRQTARHVFDQLEQAGARYWLEGGSLLGAMRSGDILPWDYDVDIGIYLEDVTKVTWLLRASSRPTTDDQGFVWEKAVEGEFYRVQYSQVNRLHVDIFPFYSRNGTMTKDTWFNTHPQDREFPEHYLRPLSSIEFVGRTVSAPNNIHDFLELKFGEGAIENPEYPNPAKMSVHGLPRGPIGR